MVGVCVEVYYVSHLKLLCIQLLTKCNTKCTIARVQYTELL